ncbi:MAG TPA: SPASM domain-containing protein, partial [bacterium]|nr:SPASM domain-containing protein [bacterium]
PVRLNAMLTATTTITDIDFLVALARDKCALLNFSSTFSFVPRQQGGASFVSFLPPDARFRELLDYIAEQKRRGAPLQFSREGFARARDWPLPFARLRAGAAELPETYRYDTCRHGDYVAFIDGDGRMYPCCNFWNDYPVLNVRDGGVASAWARLTRGGCDACYTFSYIDRNGLLALRPRLLLNYLRNALTGK